MIHPWGRPLADRMTASMAYWRRAATWSIRLCLRLLQAPPSHFTQCRTFRSTDQCGCLGTAFFPRIQ
jgi:hypothetical protein